ncbi:hypothetical protein QEG98_41270 [Myxococcus sp. MxC21-1]|uniref:hypothetical protein n=1 Tax=Myxococcus sp. MxC21-1 TaxID=3041439 RepID=UPI0029315C40|nr:hypothetical protein [Myxococcus sp. MxC21-1]WNZ62171.1 hypothetical protein QEG98_41270 [Myxococcus sp. MxC21-1]
MAHRSMDNGRDETHREADVAPPGSRERAESDLTGWNPARDEESSTRQGRYYRAATMRMALPRTQVDDGPREDAYGTPPEDSGPYGRDDRDSHYAAGWGPGTTPGNRTSSSPANALTTGPGTAPATAAAASPPAPSRPRGGLPRRALPRP